MSKDSCLSAMTWCIRACGSAKVQEGEAVVSTRVHIRALSSHTSVRELDQKRSEDESRLPGRGTARRRRCVGVECEGRRPSTQHIDSRKLQAKRLFQMSTHRPCGMSRCSASCRRLAGRQWRPQRARRGRRTSSWGEAETAEMGGWSAVQVIILFFFNSASARFGIAPY